MNNRNYKQASGRSNNTPHHSNLPKAYTNNSLYKSKICSKCKYYIDSDKTDEMAPSKKMGYCSLFEAPVSIYGYCKKFSSYALVENKRNIKRNKVKTYSKRFKRNKTELYGNKFSKQIQTSRKLKIEEKNQSTEDNSILKIYYTVGNKLMTSGGEFYNPGNKLYDKYKGMFHIHKDGTLCVGKDHSNDMKIIKSKNLYPIYTDTYPDGRYHHDSKKLKNDVSKNPLKLKKRNKRLMNRNLNK